jgi:hypothetical protein
MVEGEFNIIRHKCQRKKTGRNDNIDADVKYNP